MGSELNLSCSKVAHFSLVHWMKADLFLLLLLLVSIVLVSSVLMNRSSMILGLRLESIEVFASFLFELVVCQVVFVLNSGGSEKIALCLEVGSPSLPKFD